MNAEPAQEPVLTVGDLRLEIRRSSRRGTLQITVERDGELTVLAPEGVDRRTIAAFVEDKRFWIYKKLAEKEAQARPTAAKEYVTGEAFWYLGRSHRLRLVDQQDAPLLLVHGRFHLLRDEAPHGRAHFLNWYAEHGAAWLRDRLPRWTDRIGAKPGDLRVLDLGYRWGSCGKGGAVNFHWATILLPPPIIDYVLVHELAHLIEPAHTPQFWRLVGRVLPDFEQRRRWLAEQGGSRVVL